MTSSSHVLEQRSLPANGEKRLKAWVVQRLTNHVDSRQFMLLGLLVVRTLYLPHKPEFHLGRMGSFRLLDFRVVIGVAGFGFALALSAFRTTREFYTEEPQSR